ncbi:unnamed protein product [Candida verbasci]|uniref:ERCC4 domain-containing protein n=1 Tax=Candida verbasci TaxID=1227364 RepID=A0A9W4XNK8_9ASCO|nr:unnamed protein product [Candida verbasci]
MQNTLNNNDIVYIDLGDDDTTIEDVKTTTKQERQQQISNEIIEIDDTDEDLSDFTLSNNNDAFPKINIPGIISNSDKQPSNKLSIELSTKSAISINLNQNRYVRSLPDIFQQSIRDCANFINSASDEDNDDDIFNDTIVSNSQPETSKSHLNDSDQLAKKSSEANPKINKPKSQKSKPEVSSSSPDGYRYSTKELNEVNKVTRKKEDIYQEMKLSVGSDLYSTFEKEKSEFSSPLENGGFNIPVIFFKRVVKAIYNKEDDIFIPCKPKEIFEKTFVFYYQAKEFFIKLKNKQIDVEALSAVNIVNLTSSDDIHIIIIVEGYDQLLNRIKAFEQRSFKNKVLTNMDVDKNNNTRSKTGNSDGELSEYPSSKEIDYLVNKLQIDLKLNFFMVRTMTDSISWLNSFTYTIGSSLYDKFERNKSLANLGSVRSGSDTKSTYLQSLQHFSLMTQKKTELLHVSYKSMRSLYDQFLNHGTLGKDQLGRNIVPPTVDKSMLNFFMADDPNNVI